MCNKRTIAYIASNSAFLLVLSSASVCFATNDFLTFQPQKKKEIILAYADLAETKKPVGAKSGNGEYGISLMDRNKDSKVSKKEFLKYNEAIFDKIDTNHDGSVDKNEADNYVSGSGPKTKSNYSTSHGELKK